MVIAMTQDSPSPRVWHFRAAEDRSDLDQVRRSTQVNSDEFRKMFGYRLERAMHTEEPTQVWKWGQLSAVLVGKTWFEKANELMREAGYDYASDDYEPLPARTDSKKADE